MRDAARDALAFAEGRDPSELPADRLLAYALVKALEIVGEAANKVSPATQDRFEDIPWRGILGMRNRTIHGYQEIDHDIVWRTVPVRLPELLVAVEAAITELKASP